VQPTVENECRVGSWNELNERLYENSFRAEIGRNRSSYAFRGVCDVDYELTTSLMRLGYDYATLEHHLLRNFRKYARAQTAPSDSIWDWLAVAQHHGLPTRLLDWTFSPHVAMHFATANLAAYDRDAVIWSVDFVKAHELLPDALRRVLEEEGSDVFTAEMLDSGAKSLHEFASLSTEEFLVFFEPPSLDNRIVNQFALFSVTSRASMSMERWLQKHPGLYRKIVVPCELKWEIRDKLDQANITERVLFPGLDGLSRWLRRYYTPRGIARSGSRIQEPSSELRRPPSVRSGDG
jgi:hypothetical protein